MGYIRKTTFLLFLISCLYKLSGQNEFRKWYFGAQAGLDFSTSPPTVLTNGPVNTAEGCATICDNVGNLLFSSDGMSVWNNTNAAMANGGGLLGDISSTQSAIIVKQPGNNNIYYIFTTPAFGSSNGARYSIVDMGLSAGLGSVTVKNATLYAPSCEKQVAVRHCNGGDIWIIGHEFNSNKFRAYLLTSSGVSPTAVISAIGETPGGVTSAAIGHLKISPDGRKLAMATYTSSTPNSLGAGGFHLFDFDPSSGVVSNSLTLLTAQNCIGSPYGVEFSPDGTKLYSTATPTLVNIPATLYQWNICAGSASAIIASQYSLNLGNIPAGSVQKAIDDKIYMAVSNQQSINVINNPNATGVAMGFSFNALSTAPKYSGIGLPNYINTYVKPTPLPFTNTVACQKTSFAIPPAPTFSSGCSTTPYSPSGYMWDFGEPSSGAANTSTLTNPAHIYSGTGSYTVSLILLNPCANDTIRKVISISTPGPTPAVAGAFTICTGEKNTYTVSGGSSYLWYNNSTATTQALSPSSTTAYSVSATTNGCTLSKSFTVTVNPCTGIEAFENNGVWNIFPNPFTDVLSIESSAASTLMILDMNGKLILETKLIAGSNEINTAKLKAGVYTLKAIGTMGTWRGRFVKME